MIVSLLSLPVLLVLLAFHPRSQDQDKHPHYDSRDDLDCSFPLFTVRSGHRKASSEIVGRWSEWSRKARLGFQSSSKAHLLQPRYALKGYD
jgi:hypothetical protein